MSSLGSKLGRLGSAGPGSALGAAQGSQREQAAPPPSSLLNAFTAALRASEPTAPAASAELTEPAEPSLPGVTRDTPYGDVQLIETRYARTHRHGLASLDRALCVDGALLGQLACDPCLSDVALERALFLDTETTGLSGGTGTVPFLIGLAFFDGAEFCVEQLFLPQLGREGPMLSYLAERVASASCVVTYNGKSFDWPLLRARYVMNRMRPPPLPRHLDLLHPARRAFKARLGSVRLVALERELLSMHREGDVDGAQIPDIYLSFLRDGAHPLLAQVIEHNALDLVGLAALLGELGARYAALPGADVRAPDPRDHLSFARIAERAGDAERALAFANAVREDAEGAEARFLEARLARRGGQHQAEERALAAAIEVGDAAAQGRAHLALAKLCEHRHADFARALEHARAAHDAEAPDAHERRVARLSRRFAKALSPVET